VIRVNRLLFAEVSYLVLGLLSWKTLGDLRIRLVTLVILARFALKTWVHRKHFMHPD
jgi:hypothetical protein